MPHDAVDPAVTGAAVLSAAVLGAIAGWWPLSAWAARVAHRWRSERMPPRSARLAVAACAAAGAAAVAWRPGPEPHLPALVAFAAAAAVLAVVDAVEHRLPNAVVGPAAAAVVVLLAVAVAATGAWSSFLGALLGGAAMAGLYLLLALVSPNAMGMGDVKLAGLIGLVLGWSGLTAWLLGLLAGFLLGGVVAIVALVAGRVGLRGSIPFGPSMLAGALLAVVLAG